jgi:CRP-like cAMP-binding protein
MPKPDDHIATPEHTCPAAAFELCCAMRPNLNDGVALKFPAQDFAIPARRSIWREGDTIEGVPILCQGWAATVATMSDGRRQILSFVLPGDLVSAVLVFDSVSPCSVEAITDVRYRLFKRAEIRSALAGSPKLFAGLSSLWAEENARADQLAIDLGQRGASERIARLILSLADRLAQRRLMRDGTVEFPLRQHHIADATGLTSVHVGKVLSEFRRAGLLDITDRSLTLLNRVELGRIVGM